MDLNYLGHNFKRYEYPTPKFQCKICNLIIYNTGKDKYFISAHSLILKNLRHTKLNLTCDEILIKIIIE